MQLKILPLFLWHLVFYFFFYDVRTMALDRTWQPLLDWGIFFDCMLNLSTVFNFFLYSLGTYLSLYFFYPHSKTKTLLGILATILISVISRYMIEEVFYLHAFGFDNFNDRFTSLEYSLQNIYYAVVHTAVGGIFFFIYYGTFKERERQALFIENQKTELAFLRSQTNPHFLFNTLNNIYSLVYQKSDNALPALEKLTAILRYGLYEKAEQISLSKEVTNIQNLIALERLRFDFPLQIDMQLSETNDTIKIPPLLLLPFVENAFKHGDMKQPLSIHLSTSHTKLLFEVKNAIGKKQKDKTGGIGLANIKKRLQLIYPDAHQLDIFEDANAYKIKLSLDLKSQ